MTDESEADATRTTTLEQSMQKPAPFDDDDGNGNGDLELDFGAHYDTDGAAVEDADAATTGAGVAGSALASAKLSRKKQEALRQVPCKFFRSNGCSAGVACPFAHVMPGEGQGKAICQWYLKGNCRFGHRCALAHILPGQPMSMDRKNKRAAQHLQQTSQQPQQHQQNGVGSRRIPEQRPGGSQIPLSDINSAAQQFGGAYITPGYQQAHTGEGGDMMFGMMDDLQQQQQSGGMAIQGPHRTEWQARVSTHQEGGGSLTDSMAPGPSSTVGAMPVGSPATGPAFGTSPFSHPGSHSVFYSGAGGDYVDAERTFGRSQSRTDEDAVLRAAAQRSWQREGSAGEGDGGHAEEFLLSSLSDLLTPEELERRRRNVLGKSNMSRLAAPVDDGIASQSMPVHSRSGNGLAQDDNRPNSRGLHNQSHWPTQSGSPSVGPLGQHHLSATPSSLASGQPQSDTPRLSASNTSAGFLAKRLRGDTANTRDSWADLRRDDDAELPAYSPGVQAALSHAPGQSLPQGLAVGLSRLHLRSENGRAGNAVRSQLSNDMMHQQPLGGRAASPGVIGGARSSIDELGPVVPSSIFAQKSTPIHNLLSHSIGQGSTPASLDAGHGSHGAYGGGSVGSSNMQSPVMRAVEGGIAIPNGGSTSGIAKGTGNNGNGAVGERLGVSQRSVNGNGSMHTASGAVAGNASGRTHGQHHLGMHRLRAGASSGAGLGASPLSLPATGEEVEEAIFELE